MFPILLILTWELRYPQKRGVTEKDWSLGSCSAKEGENDLPWGRKSLPGRPGVGWNSTD